MDPFSESLLPASSSRRVPSGAILHALLKETLLVYLVPCIVEWDLPDDLFPVALVVKLKGVFSTKFGVQMRRRYQFPKVGIKTHLVDQKNHYQ